MLECGDKIGDYRLARFLGRGQFGEVWLAEKELSFSTRKFQHALKFLFKREEEINLNAVEAEIDTWIEASGHPNVMPVLDMIVHGDYVVIVSEFAEGGSLKRWLAKHKGKAPSHEKALEMMIGILRGIEHLHSRNVVHRDLKPDNILLQGNFPRITDFGISRIVSAGSLSTVAMGSPFYMSPESFDGNKSMQTDIWSAGVIFYEMLTGEHPYSADTIYGLVASIRQDEPKPFRDGIPAKLRDIVWTALQKDPAKRYQNAAAMLAAIELEVHSLKFRMNSGRDLPTAELVQPVVSGSSAITFEDIELEVPEKRGSGKKTGKANAKKTQESPPNDDEPKYTNTPAVQSPNQLQLLDRSQQTMTANLDALLEAENGSKQKMASSSHSFTSSGFGNSQSTPTRSPWMFVLGAILALGLVVGISGVFVVRTLFFSGTASTDGPVSADPRTANPPTSDKKPAPPPDMVSVPGGTIRIGRDYGEIDEKPAHEVRVDAFYMDKYEVTNEKYAEFVVATRRQPPQGWHGAAYPRGRGKFPVVGVSWDDANAYAAWKGERLASEAEWEYAARGTNGLTYPWGNDWDPSKANVNGKDLKEIGSYPCSSPFEVCDLIGNASEWTQSDFQAYPGGQLSGSYKNKPDLKTLRGGNYKTAIGYANATCRVGFSASGKDKRVGFRCVKSVGG